MFGIWIGEQPDTAVSDRFPGHVARKIEARRSLKRSKKDVDQDLKHLLHSNPPPKLNTHIDGSTATGKPHPPIILAPGHRAGAAFLVKIPDDLIYQLFHRGGWFEAHDLLRLRVCRSLTAAIGTRPLDLLRFVLPVFHSWRARVRPQTPRTVRARQNSFQRSPNRRRRSAERALLLF